MPTDRLFRYSICGITFLLSLVVFYVIFGGDTEVLFDLISQNSLVTFGALFFSTPAVGLFISTFSFYILFILSREKIHYFVPKDPVIINYVFAEFPELNNIMPHRNSEYWTKVEIDRFYPYYQIQVRKFIKGEAMDYLERRWSVYWTNTNTFSAIVAAFLTSLFFIRQYTQPPIELFKWIAICVIIIYCYISYRLKWVAREHGKKFEHKCLIKGIEHEKLEKKKDNLWMRNL